MREEIKNKEHEKLIMHNYPFIYGSCCLRRLPFPDMALFDFLVKREETKIKNFFSGKRTCDMNFLLKTR